MAEHPVAGVDYPARWQDFLAWFRDDAQCLAYLERLRWGNGFACPRCGCQAAWQRGDGLRRCSDCRHTTSVTAGTIFHLTRTPLATWFAAVWYVTNQKNGVSVLGLQRILGIDYVTAWTWLHKLRRAMVHTDGWPGYDGLRANGYRHKVTNVKRSKKLAHELMPRVHRVAALLKRWILGTHQGSVSDKHLPYYLDEFTFRFNRRRSRARGLLFYRLLQQAVHADPSPYASIVDGKPP